VSKKPKCYGKMDKKKYAGIECPKCEIDMFECYKKTKEA